MTTCTRENSLANICMLSAEDNKKIKDRAPSDYVKELMEKHGNRFEGILASNLIPPECIPYLLADDFDGFLVMRSDHLKGHVANLFY